MKKLVLLLVIAFLFSGCVYHKTFLVRAKVDEGDGQIQGTPLKIVGKGASAVVMRQVFWTNETGRPVPPLQDISEKAKTGEDTNDFTMKNIKYSGEFSTGSEHWKQVK